MGPGQFRPHSSIHFQHNMDAPQSTSRPAASPAGRLVAGRDSNDSVRQCPYHRRYKFHECFWNQRRSGAIKRYMLEKPVGDGRGRAVEIKQLFQRSCFTAPPVIGADGIGTAFGNSATGIVNGPGQANLDLALSKTVMVNWPIEKSSFQFRAEFYSAEPSAICQPRYQLHLTDVRCDQ